MLSLFRSRGITNVIYGVVIIATILVFVIQFRPNAGQKQASIKTTCVANVRGWCIDPKDFNASVRLLMPRGAQGEPLQAKAKSLKIKDVALNGLIERELLVGEADRLGLTATEQEVTDQIFNGFIRVSVPSDNAAVAGQLPVGREGIIPVGFKDAKTKKFDMKVYERTVRNLTGRSPTEFREEQTRELLAAKMRDLVRAPIRVSEPEALDAYLRQYNTATVDYVHVKNAWAGRWLVSASDADVAAWQKEHQADVDREFDARKAEDLPKAGRIRHILAETKGRASATPEAKAAALAKISEAWTRLKRGDAFAQVARDLSDDPGSKRTGGGYDKMDGFDAFFVKSANALALGATTNGAIETQFGYHILEKDDPAKTAEVETQLKKSIARDLYVKTKAMEVSKDFAMKLAADIKSGKSAEDAIKSAILPYVKVAAVEPIKIMKDDTPKAMPDAGAAGSTDAGAASDATVQKNDKATGAADGGAAVKPAPPPAPKPMTADTDPDRPEPQTSSAFSQGGDPIPELTPDGSIKVIAFAFHAKDGDAMVEPVRATDGFEIVRLKEHHTATAEDFAKDREQQLSQLLVAKQNEALSLYVQRLREAQKAAIKKDDSFLKEPAAKDGGPPTEADEEEGF
jgi:peptidyl-prolyl cis-trans isomerase D